MLEPLSITIDTCMFAGLGHYARSSTGVSPESRFLRSAADAVGRSAQSLQSLYGWKTKPLQRLWAVVEEASADGDTDDIDPRALATTEALLTALPQGFPMPEFAAEPDGSLSLDWIRSRHRVFSISVGTTNRLGCAWIDGARRGHAVEPFDGLRFPEFIESTVNAIML